MNKASATLKLTLEEYGYKLSDLIYPSNGLEMAIEEAMKRHAEFYHESESNTTLSLPDIRNKLSPMKNLIAMLENGLVKGTIEAHPLILQEIEQCKKIIEYLSGNVK